MATFLYRRGKPAGTVIEPGGEPLWPGKPLPAGEPAGRVAGVVIAEGVPALETGPATSLHLDGKEEPKP